MSTDLNVVWFIWFVLRGSKPRSVHVTLFRSVCLLLDGFFWLRVIYIGREV